MNARRYWLRSVAALVALRAGGRCAAAAGRGPEAAASGIASGLHLAAGRPFSFTGLQAEAQDLASRPWHPPVGPDPATLHRIDYDAHGKIRFDTSRALFAAGPGRFPATFFHMGRYFQVPVRMFVVDSAGSGQTAHEILYATDYFDMPADSPARALGATSGFAGFRFQENRLSPDGPDWRSNDWVAFLGASYFRAIGSLYQYGLSARGVAIDVAQPDRPEEFPAFTRFYLETPPDDGPSVRVCALLDGPSLAGAYRFTLSRGSGVVMEIEASLFMRQEIAVLGLAPLTSMYWFGEGDKPGREDWRPEVHDSDGLALWTGAGEHLWRPLNNPPRTATSSFLDRSPRGFGLLQRDREVSHYLDGVAYERRPSLWVEPMTDWGAGAVRLVEIPTHDETHDNIVAMWVPAQSATAGSRRDLRYRLHWQADEPFPTDLSRCVATRLGQGGDPGMEVRPQHWVRFVVEFLGGPLTHLPYGLRPQARVTAASGRVARNYCEAVPDGVAGHWRAVFDLDHSARQRPTATSAADPIELRMYLELDGQTLSETWLYQFHPED